MRLITLLKNTYNNLPIKTQSYLKPFVLVCQKLMQAYLCVYIYRGKSKTNNLPLTIAYVGNSKLNQNYFLDIIFNPIIEKYFTGKHLFFQVFRVLKKTYPECAMIFWEPNPVLRRYFQNRSILIIPKWIKMEIDLSQPMRVMRKQSRSGYRNIERLIREYGYSVSMSECPDDFKDFYFNMYVPYAERRFMNTASILGYSDVFDAHTRAELFLIKKHSSVVAGALVKYRDKKANLSFFGVKEGDLEFVKQGLLGAAYYFVIITLQKRGYNKIYIGDSRPMLNDGVTRFKIRLLANIHHNYQYNIDEYTYLMLLYDSPGLRDFLLHNPFIRLIRSGDLVGSIWVDPNQGKTKEEFQKICRRIERSGLQRSNIYTFKGNKLPSGWEPDNSYLNTSIHNYQDVI